MAWRFAILVLAGCWTSAGPPPSPPVGNTAPVSQRRPPTPSTTTWEGTYECVQGPTALRLTLKHACLPDSVGPVCHATGTFEFGPLPQNPNVATGAYRVAGEVKANIHGQLLMIMEPDSWIDQPGNYEMVGFTASTDRERRKLEGRINYSGCGAIELTRAGW